MSEMLQTDDASGFQDLADHRSNLLLPAWVAGVAGWSQADNLPGLRQHLAGIENQAEQNHWSERGRATSVGIADALGSPRRSVLALD